MIVHRLLILDLLMKILVAKTLAKNLQASAATVTFHGSSTGNPAEGQFDGPYTMYLKPEGPTKIGEISF